MDKEVADRDTNHGTNQVGKDVADRAILFLFLEDKPIQVSKDEVDMDNIQVNKEEVGMDTIQVDKEVVDRATILFLFLEDKPLQVGKDEVDKDNIQVNKEEVGMDTTQVDKGLVDRVTILFLSLEEEPLQVGKEEVTIQVGKEIVGRAPILENMNEVVKEPIQEDKEVVDLIVKWMTSV